MAAELTGRVAIVTGANSGIGKAAARALARRGATVVLGCRRPDRGEATRREIEADAGNADVRVRPIDLTDHGSVRRFASDVLDAHPAIHVLVNNAGIYTSRRRITGEGIESTLATNHVGPFLLTNLLLDRLKASAPARIVNVSSEASRFGRIDFGDLNGSRWGGWRAYAQSKLANILFTRELARRLDGTGVTANAVHPGTVRTNFGRGSGGAMSLMVLLARPFLISPAKGADTVVWLASSPEVEGVTGRYFYRREAIAPNPRADDPEAWRRLWEVSERLAGLAPAGSPS